MHRRDRITTTCLSLLAAAVVCTSTARAQAVRPNILVIWGDDIGWQNVSAYGMGTHQQDPTGRACLGVAVQT